jgi:hypothetical protein
MLFDVLHSQTLEKKCGGRKQADRPAAVSEIRLLDKSDTFSAAFCNWS